MTVFLGYSGLVELQRSTEDASVTATLTSSDVNPIRNRFSFDFELGQFITGDLVEFRTTDQTLLDFVAASGWPSNAQYEDGTWYVNVDELGGIMLYSSYKQSLDGESSGRIDLLELSRDLPITARVVNSSQRILGQVRSYEFNTERQAVDVTALNEDFRQQYSALISGSGRIECFFDYRFASSDQAYSGPAKEYELPRYINELVLRTKLGSLFKARLYLITDASNSSDDAIYYEVDAVITNAGMTFNADDPVVATIDFVTTGRIMFRVKTTGGYLLQENSSRIRLESGQSGYVVLED